MYPMGTCSFLYVPIMKVFMMYGMCTHNDYNKSKRNICFNAKRPSSHLQTYYKVVV